MQVPLDVVCFHHEETGVEPSGAVRRCDGAQNEVHRGEVRCHAFIKVGLPFRTFGLSNFLCGFADDQAGFLKGLSDSGEGHTLCTGFGRRATHFVEQAFFDGSSKRLINFDPTVGRVNTATGENKLVRHKFMPRSALAH